MSTAGRIVLTLVGIVLLLPGLCSIVAMMIFLAPSGGGDAGLLWGLWIFTFFVAWGGIALLRKVSRDG